MRLKEAAETKAELEAAAARLPGPEAAEQLVLYQAGASCRLCSRVSAGLSGTTGAHSMHMGELQALVCVAAVAEATHQAQARFSATSDPAMTMRCQASLREKTEQLQALSAEVSMHQAQAAEHKLHIRQLTDAINETKQQWFAQKRREQHRQHADFAASAESLSQVSDADMSKTLGGGYVVTAAA